MDIITQAEFLRAKGLNPSDKTDLVKEAIKEYRRIYMKAYRQKRKAEKIRVEVRFTLKQYAYLKSESEKYGISIPELIIKFIFAYLKNVYVVPDEVLIHAVRMEIRKVGNNINQVALKINVSNIVFQSDIRNQQKQLNEMENKIAKIFRTPVKLSDLNRNALKQNPAYIKELKLIVKEFDEP